MLSVCKLLKLLARSVESVAEIMKCRLGLVE